jgi:dTDP-4-amino-4,6-dideoxygalactose transaminase
MSLVGSWHVVEQFELRVAEYVGAPYVVAVDTCTAGLFLCFKYASILPRNVMLPRQTYLGVACAAVHAGCKLLWSKERWEGFYSIGNISGHLIVDSACKFHRGCFNYFYHPDRAKLACYSFQYRKHLKIGRGGAVATDDPAAADWLRKARFCGRAEHGGEPAFVGWHTYMEPERAARGLVLMDSLPDRNDDLAFDYPDLSTYDCLREHLA